MKEFFKKNKKNPWFWIFIGICLAGLIALPLMSKQAGNSGDEHFHLEQAEHVYDYYATGGKDSTAAVVTPDWNLPYYGQVVDNFAYFITKTFHIDEIYDARHFINSIFGWLAMFFAALIAYRIAGWRAAVFTFVLIFLSPRFLGHSFNNLKDLPLATGTIFGIYCLTRFLQEFPKIKWSTAILFAISIGLATSVRFAGILIVAYFGLFGIMMYLKRNWKPGLFKKESGRELGTLAAWGVGISLVGILLTVLAWPLLLKHPVSNFKAVFENMSAFPTSIRQLFEGNMQWSDYLPWYYTPKYILMTIPIAVIIGVILFFIFCWHKREDRFWSFLIFFTFFFPVFWIVYTKANVYGGWRHAMFSYPPMVVAAGLGFNGLVNWVERLLKTTPEPSTDGNGTDDGKEGARHGSTKGIIVNVASVVILLALLIGPIRHIIANHPYEYVYFNELVGGTKKALGQYELDYYYHSTREASEWIIANAPKKADGSKTIVGSWHPASVRYFFEKDTTHFQTIFIRWYEKENSDWDYAIFTVTGIAPEYLRSSHFPPKNTVKTIDVDGVPICIILKREDKTDFQAAKLKNSNQLDSAILLYHQALALNPDNLGALLGIGECYVRTNRPDSALVYLNHYHEIDAESEMANYMRAYAHVYKQDIQGALDILHNIEEHNPKYAGAYNLAINLYLQQRDFTNAKKQFMKVIDVDRMDDSFVKLWLQYCQAQNIDQNNAYRQLYKAMAKSYEKRGMKEQAKQYREYAGLKN